MHLSGFKSWRLRAFLVLMVVLMLAPCGAKAQRLALKTNALDYVVLSPNLTFEARLNRYFSAQVGISSCPTGHQFGGVRLKNFRVEPELRYWFNRPMAKHFVALSATASDYSLMWNHVNYVGDAVSVGVSYGFSLVLSKQWNMEAEVGAGLATVRCKKYGEGVEAPPLCNYKKVVPVPVRLCLNFCYIFK